MPCRERSPCANTVISNLVEQPHQKKPKILSLGDCNYGQSAEFDISCNSKLLQGSTVFVNVEEVEPTNNAAERGIVLDPAIAACPAVS